MCSIFGYNDNSTELASHFFASMKHRGPDDSSYAVAGNWILGQQRLAIIDLSSTANQPMKKRGHTLSLNGEIYNYLELRNKYLQGVRMDTESDTEVLLELLSRKGIAILNELNGMFALSWHNSSTGRLTLARDRYGVKPLYWCQVGDKFYFASETKPLVSILPTAKLNSHSVKSYLQDTATDFAESSYITGIKQVMPGSLLTITKSGKIRKSRWYHWHDFRFARSVYSNKQATIDKLEELLIDAIRLRYRSDVPVALTLSGGLDSTTLYTLAKEHLDADVKAITFSNTNSSIDELSVARKLAADYQDSLIILKSKSRYSPKDIEEVLKILEFPIWNISAIAYLSLYKKIHKHGFKVVIEGHGSDEQLGGYPYMIEAIWKEFAQKGRLIQAYKIYQTLLKTANKNIGESYSRWPFALQALKVILDKFTGKLYKAQSLIHRSFDRNIIPIVLRAFDRLSMSQGIESRTPYLDYRVVEFLRNMPLEYKVDELGSKAPLRHILKKYDKGYVYENKIKTGFALDISKLMKQSSIKKYLRHVLTNYDNQSCISGKRQALILLSQPSIQWSEIVSLWKTASLVITQKNYAKTKNI